MNHFERIPLPTDPEAKRQEINARRRARRVITEGYRLMGVSLTRLQDPAYVTSVIRQCQERGMMPKDFDPERD